MSKKCTPLWREAHFQVKTMYQTHHVRTTFGTTTTAYYSYSYNYNYSTLHYTNYTTLQLQLQLQLQLHYFTLHYTTLHCATVDYITPLITPHHNCNYNYTTLCTLHYNYNCATLHYNYNSATLHYNYNYNCTTPHYIQQLWER